MGNNYGTSVLEQLADAEIVADCLAKGQPVPPEVASRVRQEADRARERVSATHGVQNVGVQIIRQIRGELLGS